jgi:zinc protease
MPELASSRILNQGRFSMRFLFAILLSSASLILGATSGRADEKKLLDYRSVTLPNGLTIVSLEDFSCPIVAVHLWYHVGSKDERPERQGFAHMFEHMMFRGTDHLGRTDHFDLIRRTGGACNASTAFDQTIYVQSLPSNQLELALWLESERLGFLRIDQTAFDTERKVVEEERRLGLNRPYGTLMEKVLVELFKQHPYSWSPIGKINHLRASAAQELRDFWARYYVPNNATLVVVGAVKHEQVQQLATRYFGWMPREADPPRVTIREPLPEKARTVTIKEDNAPAPLVGMVWRTVPARNPDYLALELLGSILGGGDSSRLYRSLVAESQMAVAAMAGTVPLEQEGFFGCGAVLSPLGGDTKKVSKALVDQLDRVRTGGITDQELSKAKNQKLSELIHRNLTVESKASALGEASVIMGDLEYVNRLPGLVAKITADDLKRVASKYLQPDKALTIVVERNLLGSILGRKTGQGSTEENAPLTAKPETGAAPPAKPGLRRPADFPAKPPIADVLDAQLKLPHTRHQLANGLRVLVIPNHEVPYVDIQLGLEAGAWTETKPCTASMALGMLTKGTARYKEKELAEELDAYAISLGGSADMDGAAISAGCLKQYLDRAVGLLASVVREPTFPPEEFEKLRKQTRAGLAMSAVEPAAMASRELRRRLFGSHPYARTAVGEPKELDALTVADCAQWWKTKPRPEEAVLIFAGDVSSDAALVLAEKAFGSWKNSTPAKATALPEMPPPGERKIYLVDKPGAVQSQIRIGQRGILRSDPAYAAATIASAYFGGAFNSRLNETIRAQKGLTYGANGGFSFARFAGTFITSTFTKTESTADTIRAALGEIDRLLKEAPSTKELQDTKSFFVGSFAAGRETPQQIASELWMLELNKLPIDFFEQSLARVAKTDGVSCQKLVQSSLDPTHMVIVVVGNASKIKADLEKIAPVVEVKLGQEAISKS